MSSGFEHFVPVTRGLAAERLNGTRITHTHTHWKPMEVQECMQTVCFFILVCVCVCVQDDHSLFDEHMRAAFPHTHTVKILAGWKRISSLCSVNGPVPVFVLLFWIPTHLQSQRRRYRYSFPFSPHSFLVYRLRLQFQITSSSRFHFFLLLLLSLPPFFFCGPFFFFLTADRWRPLMNTRPFSKRSRSAWKWKKRKRKRDVFCCCL